MRWLLLIAAMSALVLAKPKPETYKETEDFQYSRSSSDDGTKSGFYGAQRGNMGGNYERAHNMDTLAQHQMSGLVRQVDGELGDGAKTRTGSVYTAANSRGIYGSGKYDLSNLQGRNFAEGESAGSSQSHSSLSSHNSAYGSQSYNGMERSGAISSSHAQDARYSGYQSSHSADQRRIDNLQSVDTSQGLGRYENNNRAGYNTQYGSRGRSEYDQNNANLFTSSGYDANTQARYVTTPVKVVVRPGGRVAIPIAVPTYSVSQNVLRENSDMNSDAEILNPQVGSTPTNKVKHYEASYSYRKQWEKHHALPGDASIIIPTENPIPKNSELYEDAQLLQSSNQLQNGNSQTVYSGSNNDHRAYTKSASSRTRYQTGYNSGYDSQTSQAGFNSQNSHTDLSSSMNAQQRQTGLSSQQSHSGLSSSLNTQQRQSSLNSQHSQLGFNLQQSGASSDAHTNAFGHNEQASRMAAELANAAGDVNSKPKSYHSSYSYHKSWERQGDPYVIKPAGGDYDGQVSEKLTAASANNAAYSSRQYGSQSRQAYHSSSSNCDDQCHIRIARSYNTDQELEGQNQWEDLGQQTQTKFENLEDLGQQTQTTFDNLEDLGQQTQTKFENLADLGQQQQNKWDNLQDLGQQTQDQWDNLQQLGQETQDKWSNLEELGQQTHRDLDQHENEKLEDFNQQSQKEDVITNFEQQANNDNDNLDVLSQNIQKNISLTNFEQQANKNSNLEDMNQHTQKEDSLTNFEQQSSNQNENLNGFDQKEHSITNFEQQTNGQIEQLSNSNNWGQSTAFEQQNTDFLTQQIQTVSNQNSNRDLFEQNQKNEWDQSNTDKNTHSFDFMKPTFSWTQTDKNPQQVMEDKPKVTDDQQNLFTLPSSNTEYNKFWSENKEQSAFWSYNENTNHKYDENFWHTNTFNNFENQFGNSFPPSTSSNTGNPLQSIWDKIDNIAGETKPTAVTTDEKTQSNGFSTFNSENKNINDMQNSNDWNYVPVKPNTDLENTNIDTEFKEHKSMHNLFEEDTQTTSTTVLPISLPSTSRPIGNSDASINTPDQHNTEPNRNIHSKDEGRGDIEPEEATSDTTAEDKRYKTPEEIESLSLIKEEHVPKGGNTIIHPSLINQENENTRNVVLLSDLSQKEIVNEKGQYELLNTVQSKTTTTLPVVEISTTVESNNKIHEEQSPKQPVLDVLKLNNEPLPNIQKELHQQTVDNVEIPEDIQQQNLEQQFEDLSQLEGSWVPTNNLQGFDQQNMDQQFEVFQQHENMQNQNPLQDFGQHTQNLSPSLGNINQDVEQMKPNQYQDLVTVSDLNNYQQKPSNSFPDASVTNRNTPEIIEPVHINHLDVSSNQNLPPKQSPENSQSVPQSQVETTTEQPGFWKSVGNKLSSAKNKVYSWFSSS